MTTSLSTMRRLVRFFHRLPEATANSVRFRVPYLLPRWFKVPERLRVAGRPISIQYLHNENAEADFIDCFLLNAYGLGRDLGDVRSIIDVGANVGFFSLAARDYYPDAIIHAYEPNPRVLPHLRANSAAFRVSVFPEAVGEKEGLVNILDEGPSGEARTRPSGAKDAVRQVSIGTAIERIGGAVDLLKLDCEGAEWDILNASGCWNAVRHLRVEVHCFNGETIDEAKAALERIGFVATLVDIRSEEMAIIWAIHRR